jgi:hypothetical protein
MSRKLHRFLCRLGWHQWEWGSLRLTERVERALISGVKECTRCGERCFFDRDY